LATEFSPRRVPHITELLSRCISQAVHNALMSCEKFIQRSGLADYTQDCRQRDFKLAAITSSS